MDQDELRATIAFDGDERGAFDRFLALGSWWPRSYTWSGDRLVDLTLEPRVGGLLSEIGPAGFRCDFGRVLAIEPPHRIAFTWQIGPDRVPQPDPELASEVEAVFAPAAGGGTLLTLVHRHFRQHGVGHERYREAMASEQGWPHLLRCFAGRT